MDEFKNDSRRDKCLFAWYINPGESVFLLVQMMGRGRVVTRARRSNILSTSKSLPLPSFLFLLSISFSSLLNYVFIFSTFSFFFQSLLPFFFFLPHFFLYFFFFISFILHFPSSIFASFFRAALLNKTLWTIDRSENDGRTAGGSGCSKYFSFTTHWSLSHTLVKLLPQKDHVNHWPPSLWPFNLNE